MYKNESMHREMGPATQKPIERMVMFVHMCVHCTVHNIAQNRPDNFPSYPPDNILTSSLAAFLFSSHPKRERDREAHLNYYASTYNRRRQLLHRKTNDWLIG